MIHSFGNQGTEDIHVGDSTKAARHLLPKELWERAQKLLDRVAAAVLPGDLKVPPGNRLEKLKGDLAGFWSVRINDQYRIIFKLEKGIASEVEIRDYH